MDKKEKFLKGIESSLEKYKSELSKIDKSLVDYRSSDKARLISQSKKLKESLKKAEAGFQDLKNSSQDKFEAVKESFLEIYDTLSDSFSELTSYLTIDQFQDYKDEIVSYGNDRIKEAERCIKKNPLTCTAWAFGIGVIVGALLCRSK
jgi:ElaB/YqjD/DUF883 family membrane-anchored ribosome-binding protein